MKNSLNQKALEEKATVTKEIPYNGKAFSVEKETLHFQTHPPYTWEIVTRPGAVAALPINAAGKLILIHQWRRAVREILYELPAGTLHQNEDLPTCMDRELQEEIGYSAKTLIPFGGTYPSPGFCNEYVHFFIAKDLVESALQKDEHEAIDVIELTLSQALKLIDENQIQDGKTIVGLLRYARWLNHEA